MFSLLQGQLSGHVNVFTSIPCLSDILSAEISPSVMLDMCRGLTVFEISTVLEEVDMELKNVQLENMVLEDILTNNEPKLLMGIGDTDIELYVKERNKAQPVPKSDENYEVAKEKPKTGISSNMISSFGSSQLHHKNRSFASETTLDGKHRDLKLNFKTKVLLTDKIAKAIATNVRAIERQASLKIKEINGTIEEIKYELSETEDSLTSFNRNVVELGFDRSTGLTHSEKFVKFCRNYLDTGMATCAKMRITSNTIAQEIHTLGVRLISAQELGGILSPMDYEVLLIRKEMQIETLEQKQNASDFARQFIGKTSYVSSSQKKQLVTEENKLKLILHRIEDIKKQVGRCESEFDTIEGEVMTATESLQRLKRKIKHNNDAPSIQDYIDLNIRLGNLQKERKSIKQKVYLLNIHMKNSKHNSNIRK